MKSLLNIFLLVGCLLGLANYAEATENTDFVLTEEAYNYQSDSSHIAIEYITGNMPKSLAYGQSFEVTATLQTLSCYNSSIDLDATTTVGNTSITTAYHIQDCINSSVHTAYYTDHQDLYLGSFTAPAYGSGYICSDSKNPFFKVNADFLLIYHPGGTGGRREGERDGYWTIDLPRPVTISAAVTPIGGYKYWIKPASATKTINVQ